MLCKVVTEGGRDWDLLVPYVLFATHETPQASTGFKNTTLPYRSVTEYIHNKCKRKLTIVERVGPVNYHLKQPGKQALSQLYHINLLKPWIEPLPALSAITILTGPKSELHHIGKDLRRTAIPSPPAPGGHKSSGKY